MKAEIVSHSHTCKPSGSNVRFDGKNGLKPAVFLYHVYIKILYNINIKDAHLLEVLILILIARMECFEEQGK